MSPLEADLTVEAETRRMSPPETDLTVKPEVRRMIWHARERLGVGLMAGVYMALAGCATEAPLAAPVAARSLHFALEVAAPPPAIVPLPIQGSYVGSPLVVSERAPQASAGQNSAVATATAAAADTPATIPSATSAAAAGSSGGGGSSSSSGGSSSSLGSGQPPQVVPPMLNLHALDRVAGGPVATGPLSEPMRQVAGLAVDPASGMVFACDPLRHQVRAIQPDGRTWIVAGSAAGSTGFDGDRLPATATRLASPVGLAFDAPSGALFVADGGNRRVRYFQPGGLIYTLAGGGTDSSDTVAVARDAAIGEPFGVASDAQSHTWFTERDTGKVRRVTGIGMLETMAQLPGGRAGAIAVQASAGLAWVSDDRAVYLIDPSQTPALQAIPIYAPQDVRITAMAHDQRDALIIATTSQSAPGTTDTRLWRILLDRKHGLALGHRPELLAGRGSSGASAADYVLPASTVPDAMLQLLAGAGFCSLAVDWTHGIDRPDASGLIYGGTSYAAADPMTNRAEVFRLSPQAPK